MFGHGRVKQQNVWVQLTNQRQRLLRRPMPSPTTLKSACIPKETLGAVADKGLIVGDYDAYLLWFKRHGTGNHSAIRTHFEFVQNPHFWVVAARRTFRYSFARLDKTFEQENASEHSVNKSLGHFLFGAHIHHRSSLRTTARNNRASAYQLSAVRKSLPKHRRPRRRHEARRRRRSGSNNNAHKVAFRRSTASHSHYRPYSKPLQFLCCTSWGCSAPW